MKDAALPVLLASAIAAAAWASWHFLGQDAQSALLTVLFVTVAFDNFCLRRKLREK